MSQGTKVDWANLGLDHAASWNPIAAYTYGTDDNPELRGWACIKHGPGCLHCYSETMNRWLGTGFDYSLAGMNQVQLRLVDVDKPLHWRKPTGVFVCSMSDLFGEFVPLAYTIQIVDTCIKANWHRFALLTKRYGRMADYFSQLHGEWTHRHIWIGVTVTEQVSADHALMFLRNLRREFPDMILWVSCEPSLGMIDWVGWEGIANWIVFGCESGKGRRPANDARARETRDWCKASHVAFYLKQLERDGKIVHKPELDGQSYTEFPA